MHSHSCCIKSEHIKLAYNKLFVYKYMNDKSWIEKVNP